jgi:hypothetical protein
MAVSDLFLSILSMDAYNRGYGAGISDGVNIDSEGNDVDGLGGIGSSIGSAIVINQNITLQAQDAGFYAVAYDTPDGIVISYRGTDEPKDVLSGWTSLVGVIPDQALLAAQFYQSVKAANPGITITLTGHSLGGALAGFVGSLYGEKAVLFNNISFELVSDEAFARATITDAEIEALFSDPILQQVVRDSRTQAISDYFPDGVPASIDRSQIKTLEVLGDVADNTRLSQITPQIAVGSQTLAENNTAAPETVIVADSVGKWKIGAHPRKLSIRQPI